MNANEVYENEDNLANARMSKKQACSDMKKMHGQLLEIADRIMAYVTKLEGSEHEIDRVKKESDDDFGDEDIMPKKKSLMNKERFVGMLKKKYG